MRIRIAGINLEEGRRLKENAEIALMKAGLYAEIEPVGLSDLPPEQRKLALPLFFLDEEMICQGAVLTVAEIQHVLLGGRIKTWRDAPRS